MNQKETLAVIEKLLTILGYFTYNDKRRYKQKSAIVYNKKCKGETFVSLSEFHAFSRVELVSKSKISV